MRRTLKLALGYSLHSLFPIVGWIVWGILKDQDYASAFALTYPMQFVWQFLLAIFGYGVETYASSYKKHKRNIALSGVLLGTLLYLVVFIIGALLSKPYMELMGYRDMKLLVPCRYSMLVLSTSGLASLISLYHNFKENYQKGSDILIKYNILTFGTLIVLLCTTRNDLISVVASTSISVLYVTYNLISILRTDIRGFRFIFNLRKSCSYVLGELTSNVGLLITYAFGISNLVVKDFSVILTFSIWTQAMDWIWDASNNVVPTMIRVDTTNDNFEYRQSAKNLVKLNIMFCMIVAIEILVCSYFYDLNMVWIAIFAFFDITDLFICIFQDISENYLSTIGLGGRVMIIVIMGYILRIILTLLIPGAFGLFFAQLIAGIFKTVACNAMYIKKKISG